MVVVGVMPRSQPAVRATALACLVLRQSYVSNSASPAADWVWIGAPNCTQKIPQRRHVQRAIAVPPATCPYGGVRVCTSVARRRCAGAAPLTCVARTDLSSLNIYSELITGIPEKFIFNLFKHGENTSVNMAWYPRRLGLLRLHLLAEGQRRNNLIMALIIRERQRLQEERRVRQYWVWP